ncbi:MAG: hypothetical protein WBY84_19250, partial [Pseudolabrys sp.]
ITLYAGLKRYHFATRNVRFGPKADSCNAKRHVRSYSKSGHVRFVPIADIRSLVNLMMCKCFVGHSLIGS